MQERHWYRFPGLPDFPATWYHFRHGLDQFQYLSCPLAGIKVASSAFSWDQSSRRMASYTLIPGPKPDKGAF